MPAPAAAAAAPPAGAARAGPAAGGPPPPTAARPVAGGAGAPPAAVPMLGTGVVRHRRLRPAAHAFEYPTYFLMLPMRSLRAQPDAAVLGVLA